MRKLIKYWSGYSRVEEILNSKPEWGALEFILANNKEFNVTYSVVDRSGTNQYRSTVFFCTHHTGALDFLSTYPYLSTVAPNLKVVMNKKLLALPPLREISLAVNPLSSKIKNDDSRREIEQHLASGGNILIFPAGKVGYKDQNDIVDFPWRPGIGDIVKNHAAFAVPVYVKARNKNWFYAVRRHFPQLSLLLLLKVLNKSNRAQVIIGSPITISNKQQMEPISLLNFIRSQVYSLANTDNNRSIL